jgi:mono/diheme cytochrome c family protein
VVLWAGVVLSACAGSSAADGGGNEPSDPALIAAGSELYAEACASCHGSDLRGTDRGPSHLSEVYEPGHHVDAAFLLAVRRGVAPHHWSFGPMPPIESFSDAEVEAIVAFVRDAQRREGFEPYPP